MEQIIIWLTNNTTNKITQIMNYSKSTANTSGSYKRNDTDGIVAEMLQKYTFIFNIFLSKKLYISILSQKNIFVSKNFVIQRKYIYIQSKYIKKILFNWFFFHINNISLFSEKKKCVQWNFFIQWVFVSQIWSSICLWNSVKLLHVLYSDFDARVKHKNKPHLTFLLLRFVFCLRGVKYTFATSGLVLDLIILLHRGNLSFF